MKVVETKRMGREKGTKDMYLFSFFTWCALWSSALPAGWSTRPGLFGAMRNPPEFNGGTGTAPPIN